MSFFKRNKSTGHSNSTSQSKANNKTPLSALQQLIGDAPLRTDGSDKFFGIENFGNTCYCNSILQCLYSSKPFREAVINYPHKAVRNGSTNDAIAPAGNRLQRINTAPAQGAPPPPMRPEDKDSPEAKKKAALNAGPILNLEGANNKNYGMEESLFSALKDVFESVVAHDTRTGVVSPLRFIEVLKYKNELFRSTMHQDAHEFLNYVLNEVVENVEEHHKKNNIPLQNLAPPKSPGTLTPGAASSAGSTTSLTSTSATSWVHDLFEGLLTSETKCLTCENISRRDEAFLDLSIDLEKNTSVTSCLKNFSASEMLCERNKFHCDGCGGLQEAEKRMKVKKLPRILALHLKRFKYMEEVQRHQKLFHRVVYPYYLRLFNTTDDAEDPDRIYELYAVVIHIGGGPYHGHYVSIVKTEDRGWLLFDDEMVEPVDRSYVRNFFGDRPGLACAYVLFYQETTEEAMEREMSMGGSPQPASTKETKDVKLERTNGSAKDGKTDLTNGHAIPPIPPIPVVIDDDGADASDSQHSDNAKTPSTPTPATPGGLTVTKSLDPTSPVKSKKEKESKKKEEKEREKAAKKEKKELKAEKKEAKEKEKEKEKDKEKDPHKDHAFQRFRPGSMSFSTKKGFSWVTKDKEKDKDKDKDKEKEKEKDKEKVLLSQNESAVTDSSFEDSTTSLPHPSTNSSEEGKEASKEVLVKDKPKDTADEKQHHHHRFGLKKKLSILSS